jgi:hypothetical protein
MNWKEVIHRWRALPEEEKHRLRWLSIPRSVARSMAFAGEPVDQELLEAEHARCAMPPLGAASNAEIDAPKPQQMTKPPS